MRRVLEDTNGPLVQIGIRTLDGSIIAFDCVEPSPLPELHHHDFTATKLVSKMFSRTLTPRP
jgi:hypothetical protein